MVYAGFTFHACTMFVSFAGVGYLFDGLMGEVASDTLIGTARLFSHDNTAHYCSDHHKYPFSEDTSQLPIKRYCVILTLFHNVLSSPSPVQQLKRRGCVACTCIEEWIARLYSVLPENATWLRCVSRHVRRYVRLQSV